MNTKQENEYELDEHISITLRKEIHNEKPYHYIVIRQTFYNEGLIYRTNEIDLDYNRFQQIIALSKEKETELKWNSI